MPIDTYGSDPEFMLLLNGQYVSAIPRVPGTAEERFNKNGHSFYWDNVLAECAIAPGKGHDEAIENFRSCFKTYAEIVAPCRLTTRASFDYPDEELQDSRCRIAGCAKDYCVYTGKAKKPPAGIIEKTSLRTGGGHIHLGQGQSDGVLHETTWESWLTVYMLDLFVGIPSLFMDHDSTSARRRKVYGQAGRYRPKAYGMEYRSLGNFWLASPDLVKLIFEMCDFTVDFVEQKKWGQWWEFDEELYWDDSNTQLQKAYKCHGYNVKDLRNALDKSDRDAAKRFMVLIKSNYPAKLWSKFCKAMGDKKYDFYKEWNIE
jgi:hypothetical protein